MTKKFFPIIARAILTLLSIIGLFCVLSGCETMMRSATETNDRILHPDTQHKPVEKEEHDSEIAENTKIPPIDETQEIPVPTDNMKINFDNTPSSSAENWINYYRSFADPDTIILDANSIAAWNKKIRSACPTMHDMADVPETLTGAEVREMIRQGKPPAAQKYDRHRNPIDGKHLDEIEANKNLSAVPDTVYPKTGIVTSRTNVRSVPSSTNFFDETDTNKYYDRIQESELILGTPVWVLHESLDGGFYFVQSYFYSGWVNQEEVALADTESYRKYIPEENKAMVCITAASTEVWGKRLDMGAVFPYCSDTADTLSMELPCRDANGRLYTEIVSVSKHEARYGYLPYTMSNFYTQAFKYEGILYGWGGADNGVDCSGFVCAVFRSFGIYLPRNTGEQKDYGGTIIPLSGMDGDTVKATLKNLTYPTALHRKGHVMLYLGTVDRKVYIIHAPKGGTPVCQVELSKLDNLICAATID